MFALDRGVGRGADHPAEDVTTVTDGQVREKRAPSARDETRFDVLIHMRLAPAYRLKWH